MRLMDAERLKREALCNVEFLVAKLQALGIK